MQVSQLRVMDMLSQVWGAVYGIHSPCPCECVSRYAFLEVFMGVCRRKHGELKKFVI